ncbi:MAG: PEP-utilizing enzyme [Candidatus Kapabacteria bacterium]|jgi:pyruvate,water dikinase|nr:PEP-utilizing enzyme [Candidatus Kapabacteria bacterium]
MRWFRKLIKAEAPRKINTEGLEEIRKKFEHFMGVLEYNNIVLKTISDMEEKSQGEFLFDINYIQNSISEVYDATETLIANLNKLGGDDYILLTEQYVEIKIVLEQMISNKHHVRRDNYTYNIHEVNCNKSESVGHKMSQLGELSSVLQIPIPDGFCVTAYSYVQFLNSNNLQEKISERIKSVNIENFEDLEKISADVQHLIYDAEVPKDLADAILNEYKLMTEVKKNLKMSVRSSAIGEDGELSFAGQYATFLNVTEKDLLYRYKGVLAGKFTPRAIYYFLSHSLNESELAMSAGCLEMINSQISGVIYTCDPVHPDKDYMVINSIFGQGEYLVDGSATPDVFKVSRKTRNVVESSVAVKTKQLILNPDGGTMVARVPEVLKTAISLNAEQISLLVDYADKIEAHCAEPQDIEFTIDSSGKMYIMQSRPLLVMRTETSVTMPDTSSMKLLAAGGTTVCPGGGIGEVFHVRSHEDLAHVPDGAVVVAVNPFPELITVMEKAAAMITRVGGVASHLATIAREYRLPSIVGNVHIDKLEDGQLVTVDATNTAIYAGKHTELVEALKPEFDLFDDNPVFSLLKRVLAKLSPLNLMRPSSPDFTIAN